MRNPDNRGIEVPPAVNKKINRAIDICRAMNGLKKRLEELKIDVRDFAQPYHDSTNAMVELLTGKGVTSVVYPAAKIEPKKGANLEALKEQLTPVVWNNLFRTKVVLSPAFKEVFDVLSKETQDTVSQYLDEEEQTPRVTFPK